MNENQQKAAERIFLLLDPWDRDPDKTASEQITDIYNEISLRPEGTINYLLDIIDDLRA